MGGGRGGKGDGKKGKGGTNGVEEVNNNGATQPAATGSLDF